MHVHYCMGQQVGASLIAPPGDHHCAKCGMKKAASKKGCCEDKQETVKAKGDAAFMHAAVHVAAVPFVAVLPALPFAIQPRPMFASAAQAIDARPHGPPRASGPRLHLRHCVFLI